MTAIINTIWGGRVSQIVDRQISRKINDKDHSIVDKESNKVIILLTKDALVSIAYTGIAVTKQTWMDCVIAKCLAKRNLSDSMIQSGSTYLNRPLYLVITELALNLNGELNRDNVARTNNLRLSIVGFHLSRKHKPLSWELKRGSKEKNGNRYFKIKKHKVGKFLRENPRGLWGETLGDHGETIDQGLAKLNEYGEERNHDQVEFYIKQLIQKRASETKTVSSECIAVQIDLWKQEGQVQITYYPVGKSKTKLLTPWILTPGLISAPSVMSSCSSTISKCGKYMLGGFEDEITKLNIQSRLPTEYSEEFKGVISMYAKERIDTPK